MRQWEAFISINADIRFGKPCVKGTRIAVADILGWLAAGMSYEEILNDYAQLSQEDILAALALNKHIKQKRSEY